MLLPRVIPVLLLRNRGLIKTVKFKNPVYVGDPINAVRIFNEKEVDELVLLDVNASKEEREPDYTLIEEIGSEAFMPFAYGGGIKTVEQARKILFAGAEKVVLNTSAFKIPQLIKQISDLAGSSSTVAAIDIKKNFFGKYRAYQHTTGKTLDIDPIEYCQQMVEMGAGELFINSVDLDGVMTGYDTQLITSITSKVNVPVIACGGAGKVEDLSNVLLKGKSSAAAAGSMFVFHGKHKAVLINYPDKTEMKKIHQLLA